MSRGLCDPWVHPLLGRLQSRVVMSSMSRGFAGPEHTATAAMADYYARRARGGVGLVLTEGTIVHRSGDGWRDAPHIETPRQADSWKVVTDAVHAAGALIACQLWHCGRISHPDFLSGAPPVSSTDRAAEGVNRQNGKPYGQPRRLHQRELPEVIEQFCRAASHALAAGFDAVELHLAHGYLPDQFLDGRVNDRTDAYGGSVENRCRFPLALVSAVISECGAARVMARISPARDMNGPYDWPDLAEMLSFFIPALADAGLRMLDVSCARADYFATSGRVIRAIRPLWPHVLVGGASLPLEAAQAELEAGWLDQVTYGRWLIANADLVQRFRAAHPLIPFDVAMLGSLS